MEKDIGKIKKNDFTDIVVRLDDFGGRPGVTIREFVTGDKYTGFTKAGVKIHAADFDKFKEMINSVNEEDLQVEKSEEAPTKPVPKKAMPRTPAGSKAQKTLDEEPEIDEDYDMDEMPDY